MSRVIDISSSSVHTRRRFIPGVERSARLAELGHVKKDLTKKKSDG